MTQKVVVLLSGTSWADPGDTNGGVLDSVECFGDGGGGAGANNTQQPGGGGGGQYAACGSLTVTFPVPYGIGTGGAGGGKAAAGGNGTGTWFNGTSTASCSVGAGGGHGATNAGASGAGGSGTFGTATTTRFSGGAGGTDGNNGTSGCGGGGCAGPSGAGKAGGTSNNGSNGGGTGGGGADNGTVGVANPTTGVGSAGGTPGGDVGTAGAGGTSGAVNGTAGTNGAGGGGGYGGSASSPSAVTGGNGGAGSNETIYTDTASGLSYGPGGGGGGGGGGSTTDGTGGNGGLGGGGGGAGGRKESTTSGGNGGAGFIVIKYTPTGGPHISSPQPAGHVYPSTQNLSCTTDTSSGTLYAVVDTVANISGITVAQVKAGENNTGAAAAFSGNHAVSSSNPSVRISGLSSGTTYGFALVQNATTDSSVATGSFTVDSAPVILPILFQHVGGGGNPFTRAQTGNSYKIPLPQKSGAGNCYLLAITYDGGATVSSVSGAVNGSLGADVVHALPGAGFLDSRLYVLPNITAGQETITVTFGASVRVFQYVVTEVFGVATASVVNGSSSVANSTTIGAGSFTPTNNDANGGNFIWSYFAKAVQTPTSTSTSISSNGGATLLNADIGWNSAADSLTKACQGLIQETAAAINPSVSSASDTGDAWNSLAVALKISLGSGTPPAAQIRINKIDHFATEHYGTSGTYNLQCPAIGNLRAVCSDDPNLHATTVTDSDGNTWTSDGTGNPGGAQWWYLANATPNPNLVVHIAGGGLDATLSWRYVDLSYAAASPFDSAVANGQTVNTLTSFTATPSPSPVSSSGMTLANIGLGNGPGLGVTAPTGAIWDLCTYTGEVDTDLIENADITAHYSYSAAGAQTWTFSITSRASNSTSGGFISFKGATAGPVLSAPTPSGNVTGTTQSIGCTTDTASGTLYVVVDTVDNILGVTASQVIAGQNVSGVSAAFSGNSTVASTSPSKSITGLSTGTTYGFAIAQVGSANSDVLLGSLKTAGNIFSYTGTGGLTLAGAGTELRARIPSPAGGLAFAGTSAEIRKASPAPSSGLSFSGSGVRSFVRPYTASGGLALAGASAQSRALNPHPSGGLVFAGAATESSSSQRFSYTGAGGIVLSGSAQAAYHVAKITVTMAGGITLSGSASVSFTGQVVQASPWAALDPSIGGAHLFRVAHA